MKKKKKKKNEFESVIIGPKWPWAPALRGFQHATPLSDLKDVKKKELEKNEVKKKEVKDQNDTVKQTQRLTSFNRTVAFYREDLRKKLKKLSCFRLKWGTCT